MKGYRTVTYNAITGIGSAGLLGVLAMTDWQAAGYSPETAMWLVLGFTIADRIVQTYLRSITTTPMFKK